MALVSSCADADKAMNFPENSEPPNILLIIADDLGKDAISGFNEGILKPNTPNIDAIRNNGISFSNFWVYPTCSPTRASIITGKYGYRTNVKTAGDELSSSEMTLQKHIRNQTSQQYASAVIGKWHLSGVSSSIDQEAFGLDYFAGIIRGAVEDYYQWSMNENGVNSTQTTYSSTVFTDLSINWINQQSKPWFLWLAYNAPHTPFHVPPSEMHSQGALPTYTPDKDPLPYYLAAIEAMDYQIGRLIESIPEEQKDNTIIIFLGDNGTPAVVAQSPYSSSTTKNTLYQGGINTPLFISGKGVSRTGIDSNLITGTDLFATISEIAGINSPKINDSKSFKSLFTQSTAIRNFQYAEMNNGLVDQWAIRKDRFKLFVDDNGNQELYDLENDPYETIDLWQGNLTTEALNAKNELEVELTNIRN